MRVLSLFPSSRRCAGGWRQRVRSSREQSLEISRRRLTHARSARAAKDLDVHRRASSAEEKKVRKSVKELESPSVHKLTQPAHLVSDQANMGLARSIDTFCRVVRFARSSATAPPRDCVSNVQMCGRTFIILIAFSLVWLSDSLSLSLSSLLPALPPRQSLAPSPPTPHAPPSFSHNQNQNSITPSPQKEQHTKPPNKTTAKTASQVATWRRSQTTEPQALVICSQTFPIST